MFKVMLSIVFVLAFTAAADSFAQIPAGAAPTPEQIRENAATIPEETRNRMTNECNSKFIRSGQPATSRKGFLQDCMSESIKNSRTSGEVAPTAK